MGQATSQAAPVMELSSKEVLSRLQRRRKWWLRGAVALSLPFLPFIRGMAPMPVEHALRAAGMVLIVICIFGRAWCILYIGGRKTSELIDIGPYSVSRNPLYFFSFMGALGLGLQFGSVLMGLAFLGVAMTVFVPLVRREEGVLGAVFGETFRDYCNRVPRFLPRPSVWQDARRVTFAPRLLYTTLRDGLVFVAGVVLLDLLQLWQVTAEVPILLRLI